MKSIIQFIIFLIGFYANQGFAGLADRLKIEDLLKERLEKAVQINEPLAKVTVKIEFNKILSQENLPGTTLTAREVFYSENLENKDISKIFITFFSGSEKINSDQANLIYSLTPVDKNKISLISKQITFNKLPEIIPVQPSDLKNITDTVLQKSAFFITICLVTLLSLLLAESFFSSLASRNLFKKIMPQLTSSLNTQSGAYKQNQTSISKSENKDLNSKQVANYHDYSSISLAALLSDFYWCALDSESLFLWKKLNPKQKIEQRQLLPFLDQYIQFFSQLKENSNSWIEHSYYENPLSLNLTSQDYLLKQVQKNLTLWNTISPVRQKFLDLNLSEKVEANLAKRDDTNLKTVFPVSPFRQLERIYNFGQISDEEENQIFNNPDAIPQHLRSSIKTLAWLSLKNEDFIKQQFLQLDAKDLALAWSGSELILNHLEQFVPESKLKLIKSYIKQSLPSKESDSFKYVFNLAFRDDEIVKDNTDEENIKNAS